MKKSKIKEHALFWLFCAITGMTIAVIVWGFLKIMNYGIAFLWEHLPSQLNFPFYTLTACIIGGILLGVFQHFTKAIPDDLNTVMAKSKKDKNYPFNKTHFLFVSALIPLLFGGSIGPEAGLTGIIVGLCYWAGSRMKYTKFHIDEVMEIGIAATLGSIFYAPLFGIVSPVEEKINDSEKRLPKRTKIIANIIAVLSAIGILYLLRTFFGGSEGLPRIDSFDITNTERLYGIPLAILGGIFGLLFILLEKGCEVIFQKIRGKLGIIISCILGGLILGIVGTYLPLTMFSGEESITHIQQSYGTVSAWILIGSGLLKLLITNVCIQSGWKGGHFFPVIFCGVSIGFGVALLLGIDHAFCAAVITAGILGASMKKPLAVTVLLMLCFDVRIIPWILLAAFLGSLIPDFQKKEKTTE